MPQLLTQTRRTARWPGGDVLVWCGVAWVCGLSISTVTTACVQHCPSGPNYSTHPSGSGQTSQSFHGFTQWLHTFLFTPPKYLETYFGYITVLKCPQPSVGAVQMTWRYVVRTGRNLQKNMLEDRGHFDADYPFRKEWSEELIGRKGKWHNPELLLGTKTWKTFWTYWTQY